MTLNLNRVNPLLARIAELGLTIDDDNRNFIIGNERVEELTNKWVEGREYVIGEVPASNESLENVEFDICFEVIERNHDRLSSGVYKFLHKLAENNNSGEFVSYLHTVKDARGIHASMAEEIEDCMHGILEELNGTIEGLGGNEE